MAKLNKGRVQTGVLAIVDHHSGVALHTVLT